MTRFGDPEKRVPNCSKLFFAVQLANGGRGTFKIGRFLTCLTPDELLGLSLAIWRSVGLPGVSEKLADSVAKLPPNAICEQPLPASVVNPAAG